MSIRITEARSQKQIDDVARFRYETYVEEMERPQKYADHERRRIWEPLDETGRVTVAYNKEDRVIGTMRINYGADCDLGEYRDFYQMEEFGDHFPEYVTTSTKLMVAQTHRSSTLALRLAIEAYRFGLKRGALLDFIDCNQHLEGFFHKLGYRQYCGRKQHPEYGDVLPMVLYAHDFLHLSLVGSPLLRSANEILKPPPVATDHRKRDLLTIRGAA